VQGSAPHADRPAADQTNDIGEYRISADADGLRPCDVDFSGEQPSADRSGYAATLLSGTAQHRRGAARGDRAGPDRHLINLTLLPTQTRASPASSSTRWDADGQRLVSAMQRSLLGFSSFGGWPAADGQVYRSAV